MNRQLQGYYPHIIVTAFYCDTSIVIQFLYVRANDCYPNLFLRPAHIINACVHLVFPVFHIRATLESTPIPSNH
ncbi:hypothetical protein BU16DRAFT_228420 [Lophium mytilinum]|uniref:Uncharacterized protein n=1 Tax=Lophium mytilinum TaxID=390894 RepID=A0A6A6Q7X6_9PEZI|nr:hypothetical protein BU16DRAFT_228420 [Lophium mytilinum]